LCEAIDIGGAQPELAGACMQLDLSWVDLLELSNDLLGAIWGVIIDYNYLHVDFTIGVMVS
jgi:hypothetical protein